MSRADIRGTACHSVVMTRTRAVIASVVIAVIAASCGSAPTTLIVRDLPASTTDPPEQLLDVSNSGSPVSTAPETTSTTITSAQRRSGSAGEPLSAPTSVPRTVTAVTTTTAQANAEGVEPAFVLSAGGGYVVMSDRSGWRTLDHSCTVTDEASAGSFGFTADASCYDPASGQIPESQRRVG